MNTSCNRLNNRQQGIAMVVTLLMLLVMTILGMSVMQTSTQEERMAGNMRDRSLAFEAAEAVLREAEQEFIAGLANTSSFDGSNGLYGWDDAEPANLFGSNHWITSNSRSYSEIIPKVASQPRYRIKLAKEINTNKAARAALNIEGYGVNKPGEKTIVFRITAHGVGGSDRSQVVLQSHYGKTF